LGGDAEVSLQLISTGQDRAVLGTAQFVVPAEEIKKRNLSLLPPKDTAVISQSEYNIKQTAIKPYSGDDNAFTFTVNLDDLDGIYYDSEYMTMHIYSNRDCYFKITHVDVNGTTQIIYPAVARDNNFIRAGETRRIPDNTRFRMGKPYGEEYILVAAYEQPFTITANTAAPISETLITRGLSVMNTRNQTEMQPAATARFSYTILPGN
jgi:hypothetical protein